MTSPLVLSILMLSAFALAWGGGYLLVRRRERTRGILMLAAAGVMLVDALILGVPR